MQFREYITSNCEQLAKRKKLKKRRKPCRFKGKEKGLGDNHPKKFHDKFVEDEGIPF